MTLQADRALRDREIVELLADDPALLAIVDALHCTQRPKKKQTRVAPLLASALVAGAVAVALVAPWQSNGGIVPRALAAIGRQPVLHVVTEQTLSGISTLDLKTGRLVPSASRTEVFFDAGRKLQRVISVSPLHARSDELHTATGDWVNGSPVYTCAWIAAHPAAAAKARVSCPAGLSTSPQPPTLDAALTALASGYRTALRSGHVRQVGGGKVGGRPVHWLAIGSGDRVAVDARTLLPVFVRHDEKGHLSSYRVLTFETAPFAATDFVRAPAPIDPQAAGQSVHGVRQVNLAAARRALGGTLAVPNGIPRLRFQSARVVSLLTGYAGKKPFHHSVAVELIYRYGGDYLTLHEAREPDMIAGFTPGVAPTKGEAIVRYTSGFAQLSPLDRARLIDSQLSLAAWRGLMRAGGLYLTIGSWSKPLLLQVASELTKETH